MAKIIYFTTAQKSEDFAKNLSFWNVAPNTSNQNFHNRLIRALASQNEVEAISIRPINSNFKLPQLDREIKKESSLTWVYPKVKNNKIYKFLSLYSETSKMIPSKEGVVVVDVLSLSLLRIATKFAKRNHLKIIGICTDNPQNISFSGKGYAQKVFDITKNFDGYVALTPKLNELFNVNNKPCIIIDGVTEEKKTNPVELTKPYIFFCGSLMHEYGVYNLVKAFDNLKLDNTDLVICGHHKEPNFESFINTIDNVKFLGVQPYDKIVDLENHSLLSVNPRPLNDKIDEYSIPSKTLESLSNGALTICTTNELLRKNYESAIIWAESGEVEDLQAAINAALNLTAKEKAEIISAGKKLVKSRTSFEHIAKMFEQLL